MSYITTGQRIEYLRKKRGLTQKELADLIHIQRNKLSYYETDERTPTVSDLIELSKALNTTIDYLVGHTNTSSTDKNIRFICDYTGLTDKVVKMLHAKKGCYILFNNINDIFKFVYGIED